MECLRKWKRGNLEACKNGKNIGLERRHYKAMFFCLNADFEKIDIEL